MYENMTPGVDDPSNLSSTNTKKFKDTILGNDGRVEDWTWTCFNEKELILKMDCTFLPSTK